MKKAGGLCLVAMVALAGCTSDKTPGVPATSESANRPLASSATDGADAQAILDRTFQDIEVLGSGYGLLQPALGNTLAGTREGVLTVTFAFTCTGGATANLKIISYGKEITSTAGTQRCDGSIYQTSVETPTPRQVGFTADITGTTAGSFGYGYYPEKQQRS